QEWDVCGIARADLVRLMAGRAAGIALVQNSCPKRIARLQAGARKYPMIGLDNLIRSRCHGAGVGEHDAEQIGFGFDLVMKTALVTGGPLIQAAHGAATIEEFDLAIQAVTAEIQQPPALLEDPAFDL